VCELYTRASLLRASLPFICDSSGKGGNWRDEHEDDGVRECNLGGGPGSAPRCDMRGAACNH